MRRRSPGDLQERLERLGVYRREGRPWLPHLTVARWRERPRLRPSRRRGERSFRPTRLLTYPDCTPTGRGTKSWNLSL